MFPKIMKVSAVKPYSLWLQFSDGTEGVVDLSNVAGKGVFSRWNDPAFFQSVRIDSESNAIAWGEGIDICPDSLFLQIKNLTFEEWKKTQLSHAAD